MADFTTDTVPVNNYGDLREVLIISNWQSDYAKYLAENNLVLDKNGNPVKEEDGNVQRNTY